MKIVSEEKEDLVDGLVAPFLKLKTSDNDITPMDDKEPSVKLNVTTTHVIGNLGFGNLPNEKVIAKYKDGRAFSHFIELWLGENYPLTCIEGCKRYDFTDEKHPEILYDEKTFTSRGCHYCPSNMLGQGRKFDKSVFEEKTKQLVFCIVSNVNFPEIKVKFMRGVDLLQIYPKGKIPTKDHDKFFE